ncbi:MAG: hypothetical protein LBQ79_00705 [Deltaproteobacteria bacterium]|nr:hypothetical protein [Deltaproteobacteria bacterium]
MAADNNTGEGVPEESEDADGEDSGKDGGAPDAGSLRDGAVNIMTIHRSKGLERRVVVVPQAHVPDRARSKSLLIGDGGELALKFVPVGGSGVTTGPQYGELRKEDLAKSREEHLRIFYVAATRARDRLVLVGDSIRPQTYKLLKADWESGAGGGGAPVSGRSEEFDRYGWLHHLESWPRRSGHLELRDAGPERYYKAWNPPDAPAVGGHAGIGKAGSTGSGMAGAYGIGKSGLAGTEKAGSEGIGKAGTTGTGKGGAEGSWNAGTAVPSSPADGGGEFRPAMIDPLPPTGAWTGTVTSYARLLAEGEGALRNSRRDVGARVADPWGRYAGEGGDALDDPVSSEGARLDKAGDMGVADGVAGGAEPPAGAAPAGDPGHREQGIIVHAILESTDFASDLESYRAAVRRAADANGIALSDVMEDELAGHALRFQESRMGREVREALEAGREVWREWPFWFRMEDDGLGRGPVTLSGVVDLFYVNSRGEGVLVDYKLFRPRDAASYDRQVEIYAKALRSATGFAGTVVAELRYLTEKE